jgi:hypothetical protein
VSRALLSPDRYQAFPGPHGFPLRSGIFLAFVRSHSTCGRLAASWIPRVRQRSAVVNVEDGKVFGRGLKDVGIVMDLHEFAPVGWRATSGRDGGRPQHQHPCRPSSALLPTHIGTTAEPVLFLLYFFLFFLLSIYGYPSRPHPSARDFRPLIPAQEGRRPHGRLGG